MAPRRLTQPRQLAFTGGRDQPLRSCSAEPARRFRLCRRVSLAADCLLLATAESAVGTRASGLRPALGLCVRPMVTQLPPRQRLPPTEAPYQPWTGL